VVFEAVKAVRTYPDRGSLHIPPLRVGGLATRLGPSRFRFKHNYDVLAEVFHYAPFATARGSLLTILALYLRQVSQTHSCSRPSLFALT
jgi:hypothetical protein